MSTCLDFLNYTPLAIQFAMATGQSGSKLEEIFYTKNDESKWCDLDFRKIQIFVNEFSGEKTSFIYFSCHLFIAWSHHG